MADAYLPLPEVAAEAARAGAAPGHRRHPARGYALVLLGASLFIVNAGVSRVVLTAGGVDADRLAALRSTGSALVLLLAFAVLRRGRTLRLARSDIPYVIGYGIVGVALLQWLYFVAIERLPVGIALLLEYTAPVLIALWARFVRHEPVRARLWPALGLALLGLALVAQVWGGGAGLDGLGVLAGLGAAVAFAAYFLIGERLVHRYAATAVSFWGFAVGAAFWTLFGPWWRVGEVDGSVGLSGALAGVSAPLWLLLAWVVVLGTLVPFAVETLALRDIPATVVALVAMVEPVGAAVLAWAWFGEALLPVQIAGGLLVVTGIVLAQTARAVRIAA